MKKYALVGRAKKSRGVHESFAEQINNQALFSSAVISEPAAF